MTEQEISGEEVKAMRGDPAVVNVEYDDSPEWVAAKFVEVLTSLGVDVEVLVPPADFPTVFYRIKPRAEVQR